MRKPIARNLAFRLVRVWITACALLFLTTASAYDMTTHAAMTSEAVAASQITRDPNASAILKRLGILDFSITTDLLDRSLGKNYVYQGWTEASKRIASKDDDALAWPEFGNEADKDIRW